MLVSPRSAACAALFAAAAAAVVGCQRTLPPPPAPPPPQVTVVRPATAPVQAYYEYNGHLAAIENVDVKARVKGFLTEIKFKEGEEVTKGQPLYSIDQREYRTAIARADADIARAAADIQNWKAQITLARSELARVEDTVRRGAGSKSDVDKAAATLEVNQAQLAVAEAVKASAQAALHTANIQLGYTDIKSPIDGRINRTMVTVGNLVGQDAPTMLTRILSVDPLYVEFDVPERDLIAYQQALLKQNLPDPTSGTIPVEVGVGAEDGYPHKGMLVFRENAVNPGTGTVMVRGRVPNPQLPPNNARLLYPGLYARVRVPDGPPQPRLVLPEAALQAGQEGRFVLVIGPENKVEKRSVTVGPVVFKGPPPGTPGADDRPGWVLMNPNPPPPAPPPGGAPKGPAPPAVAARLPVQAVVAVLTGLKPDDRVVVNGLQKARPGAPVNPDLWDFRPTAGAAKPAAAPPPAKK